MHDVRHGQAYRNQWAKSATQHVLAFWCRALAGHAGSSIHLPGGLIRIIAPWMGALASPLVSARSHSCFLLMCSSPALCACASAGPHRHFGPALLYAWHCLM